MVTIRCSYRWKNQITYAIWKHWFIYPWQQPRWKLKTPRAACFSPEHVTPASVRGVTSAVNKHWFGLKKYNSMAAFLSTFINVSFLVITWFLLGFGSVKQPYFYSWHYFTSHSKIISFSLHAHWKFFFTTSKHLARSTRKFKRGISSWLLDRWSNNLSREVNVNIKRVYERI